MRACLRHHAWSSRLGSWSIDHRQGLLQPVAKVSTVANSIGDAIVNKHFFKRSCDDSEEASRHIFDGMNNNLRSRATTAPAGGKAVMSARSARSLGQQGQHLSRHLQQLRQHLTGPAVGALSLSTRRSSAGASRRDIHRRRNLLLPNARRSSRALETGRAIRGLTIRCVRARLRRLLSLCRQTATFRHAETFRRHLRTRTAPSTRRESMHWAAGGSVTDAAR